MFPHDLVTFLIGIIILIFADLLLGICVSLKQGTFDVRRLPQFLQTAVLPYIGGLTVLLAAASFNSELKAALIAAAMALGLKYVAEIKDKLILLFGLTDMGTIKT